MTPISRKNLLKAAAVAVPASLLVPTLPAMGGLEPTPYCEDGDDPTPPQMEGPYFKPSSPRRTSIVDGPGTSLTLSGTVYGLACQPIANALLDFWQADNRGAYDNVTYRFRGHQFTNAAGQFSLSTIIPGLYPGRTRHIHVKVQAPGRPILTTQLYFPNEPRNATDPLYNRVLLITNTGPGAARFDFVLNIPGTTPPTTRPPSSPPPGGGTTWAVNTVYRVGDRVTYAGLNYQCQIGHTSQPGWEPPNAPALWARV